MKKSDAIPSKYFRAKDLPDGWTLMAEVEMARMEKFEGGRGKGDDQKMVVYFRRQRSGLVLGSITWDQMVEATDNEEDSDRWAGHIVELFKTTTPFGRETVDCIRVRKPDAPAKKPSKKSAPKDDKPDYDDKLQF